MILKSILCYIHESNLVGLSQEGRGRGGGGGWVYCDLQDIFQVWWVEDCVGYMYHHLHLDRQILKELHKVKEHSRLYQMVLVSWCCG